MKQITDEANDSNIAGLVNLNRSIMRYLLIKAGWWLVLWLMLISCHKPIVNAPVPTPTIPECKILQIVMSQAPQTNDTAFFEDGLIKEIRGDNGNAKFKLDGTWLQRKDEYSKTNIFFRQTSYSSFYGKVYGEYINDYPNLTSITNRHKEYVWSFDTLVCILYFNTDRSTQNFTWKINFVYDNDGNIKSASQYDTTSALICTYNFSYDRNFQNAFKSIFAFNPVFYFVDTSPYNEAIKTAFAFSNGRLTKVTATTPGFTPLNFDYTDYKNKCEAISMNNQQVYSFKYTCD
jgi:hypothetical protein